MEFMKSTNPTNISDLHHEFQSGALGETYIKSFSQRTGEQARHLINDFLAGILILFLVDRLPTSAHSAAVTPNSDKLMTAHEIAAILNISKAKAYQSIQKGEIQAVKFR
jgi:hypothetical protein